MTSRLLLVSVGFSWMCLTFITFSITTNVHATVRKDSLRSVHLTLASIQVAVLRFLTRPNTLRSTVPRRGGLLQLLARVCCPPSHFLLQTLHDPNALQPPFTERAK